MVKKNFEKLIINYLESNFNIKIEKIDRSWLKFPSGIIAYMNGSYLTDKKGEQTGWYDLDKKIYDKLIGLEKSFYLVVFGIPEQTFVLPKEKIKDLFEGVEPGKDNEWHYHVVRKEGHYFILRSYQDRIQILKIDRLRLPSLLIILVCPISGKDQYSSWVPLRKIYYLLNTSTGISTASITFLVLLIMPFIGDPNFSLTIIIRSALISLVKLTIESTVFPVCIL